MNKRELTDAECDALIRAAWEADATVRRNLFPTDPILRRERVAFHAGWQAAIAAQPAQEAMQRDAERYRNLRKYFSDACGTDEIEEFDADVDRAIAERIAAYANPAAQPERAREPVAWFVVSYTQSYPHYLQLPPLPQLGEGWQAVPLYFGDPKGKP